MTAEPASEGQILALTPTLRRVANAMHFDGDAAQDIVQETQARLLANRHRLTAATLTAYAVVVARNLAASAAREHRRDAEHRHRLATSEIAPPPDDMVLLAEEHAALRRALAVLPPEERALLTARDVEDRPTAALAAHAGSTPQALAVRLSRARARLRVEFLLAFRQVEPATPRCRPVLLAISAGDRRRQAGLGAGRHLLACTTCSTLAEPLLHRRRGLAGVLPLAAAAQLIRRTAAAAGRHPVQATATAASVTAAATVAGVLAATPAPRPNQPAILTVAGHPLMSAETKRLAEHIGQPAVARGARVQSVPVDEGFWITVGGGARVYVQLAGSGESPQRVRPDDRVRFRGRVVANTPALASSLDGGSGAGQLRAEGAHLVVRYDDLRLD